MHEITAKLQLRTAQLHHLTAAMHDLTAAMQLITAAMQQRTAQLHDLTAKLQCWGDTLQDGTPYKGLVFNVLKKRGAGFYSL